MRSLGFEFKRGEEKKTPPLRHTLRCTRVELDKTGRSSDRQKSRKAG